MAYTRVKSWLDLYRAGLTREPGTYPIVSPAEQYLRKCCGLPPKDLRDWKRNMSVAFFASLTVSEYSCTPA